MKGIKEGIISIFGFLSRKKMCHEYSEKRDHLFLCVSVPPWPKTSPEITETLNVYCKNSC